MNDSDRRKNIALIVIFSAAVSAIAWAGPQLGGGPSSPGLGFLLWGTAPLVVTLLMRTLTCDWSDFGIRPGLKGHSRWYVLSALALPAAMAVTLLIGTLAGVSSVSHFSAAKYGQTVLTALGVFLVFALFEEVGWRGYLAPKLASLGISSFLGHATVAIVWASWHWPYLRELTWIYAPEDMTTFVPRFYLATFALSVLYGEIRAVTGTFWPAVLMHGVGNAVGHPLAADYVTVAGGEKWLGSVGDGIFTIALIGALGLVVHRWRTKKSGALEPAAG